MYICTIYYINVKSPAHSVDEEQRRRRRRCGQTTREMYGAEQK